MAYTSPGTCPSPPSAWPSLPCSARPPCPSPSASTELKLWLGFSLWNQSGELLTQHRGCCARWACLRSEKENGSCPCWLLVVQEKVDVIWLCCACRLCCYLIPRQVCLLVDSTSTCSGECAASLPTACFDQMHHPLVIHTTCCPYLS